MDNSKTKTAKDPEYFRKAANEKGLTKHSELLSSLKSGSGSEHSHANTVIIRIPDPEIAKRRFERTRREKSNK